jgi:hypothetical protein
LEGATGSLAGGIVITNGGLAACRLLGPPLTVQLRSGDVPLNVAVTRYQSLQADDPGPAPPVLLKPGQTAVSFKRANGDEAGTDPGNAVGSNTAL